MEVVAMNADAYRRIRDFYAITPGAPIYKKEFGFYVMDRWIAEGYVKAGDDLGKLFDYNDEAFCCLHAGGMMPGFEVKVLFPGGNRRIQRRDLRIISQHRRRFPVPVRGGIQLQHH